MSVMHRAMAVALRAAGWQCFPPPPAPAIASTWIPQRGAAQLRTVTGAGPWGVSYQQGTEEARRACGLATWHRWISKSKAVQS